MYLITVFSDVQSSKRMAYPTSSPKDFSYWILLQGVELKVVPKSGTKIFGCLQLLRLFCPQILINHIRIVHVTRIQRGSFQDAISRQYL